MKFRKPGFLNIKLDWLNSSAPSSRIFFNKAIATGPYLGESYSAMAKTYFLKGEVIKAESMMEKALSLSLPSHNRALYTAKLQAIQNSQ